MFTKWELVEEGKPMICESFSYLTGYLKPERVIVDIYRKKKLFSGIYKYKHVIRGY